MKYLRWFSGISIRKMIIAFWSLTSQHVAGNAAKESASPELHIANTEYGPTRWLHPCGEIRFSDMGWAGMQQAIQPLLLGEDELAPDNQQQLIVKIADYYDDLLSSQITEIAKNYTAELASSLQKYYPIFMYEVMEENGWKNPWGITDFKQYLEEILKGCHNWPPSAAAKADFQMFTRLMSTEKRRLLVKKIVDKQETMLKEQYENWFEEDHETREQSENIFLRIDDNAITLLDNVVARTCRNNIQNRQKSLLNLVKKLQEDQINNQLLHGKEIEKSKNYAHKSLQRVAKTALGKLAKDCHALTSGNIIFVNSGKWQGQSRYHAEKNSITVMEDDEFSRVIWDSAPPWLTIFDGFLLTVNSDQMLLEGLIQSLCYFITLYATPDREITEILPYWNGAQQSQWMIAMEKDRTYLKQIAKIVSAVFQEKKLKKDDQKIWNQLTRQVDFIYRKHFPKLEASVKRHVRHLKFFNISLEKIRNEPEKYSIYNAKKGKIAGEEIEFSEKYQKIFRIEWIKNATCEDQSMVWSTLQPSREFDSNEMTISAFLWVYYQILRAEPLSSIELLSGYGRALMALDGQEKLAALFVPNLHRYTEEVILPMGNKIYKEIHSRQSSTSIDNPLHEPVVAPSFEITSYSNIAGISAFSAFIWILRNLLNKNKKNRNEIFLNKLKRVAKKQSTTAVVEDQMLRSEKNSSERLSNKHKPAVDKKQNDLIDSPKTETKNIVRKKPPKKKPKQIAIAVPEDIKENRQSTTLVIKPLDSIFVTKIISCIEQAFHESTGRDYDFSQPYNMANILLTKFIQLAYMIRTTVPDIHVEAYGGILLALMMGEPPNDLDMVLRVPSKFINTTELLESLKQQNLITKYRKSAKKYKELFVVSYCNSNVDMRISRLSIEKDTLLLDYTCDTFTLDIGFSPPSAKINAPGKSQEFLIAVKNKEKLVIEAVINPTDGLMLANKSVRSYVINMIKAIFQKEYTEKKIISVMTDLKKLQEDALDKSILPGIILTILSYIRDPERIFRLIILYRRYQKHNFYLSSNLNIIIKLIPFLFHTAIVLRNDLEEKSPFNREILFFYFKKYIIKNIQRFNILLPEDLILFQSVILAGMNIDSDQKSDIDKLFSSAFNKFPNVREYLLENLEVLKNNKKPHVVMDMFLIAITWVQDSSIEFMERLKTNVDLLGYRRNFKKLLEDTTIKGTSQYQYRLLPSVSPLSSENREYKAKVASISAITHIVR